MVAHSRGWQKMYMQDVMLEFYDGLHATPKPAKEGPVFLGIKNITEDGRLNLSDVRHIAEEDYANWIKRVTPRTGDIVFSYEATLHLYAIIPEGFRGCLGRRLALIRPNPEVVDTRFLFYHFFGKEWRKTASKYQISGSTVDRIPLITFPKFEVTLPPLPTQRRIAAILSAYDDLIENNTHRIRILEEMAQLLYREWFVHFRFPGHEGVKMKNGVPVGWAKGVFSDIAELSRDNVNPGKFEEESFAHYSIPAFDEGQMPVTEQGSVIKSNKFLVRDNCVLLSKINPRITRVWLPVLEYARRAIASTEFLVLTPKPPATRAFLFNLCQTHEFLGEFTGLALGTSTSHQRVKPDDLLKMSVSVPTPALVVRYDETVMPLLSLVHTLRVKNANLRRTRDLLLPRLVSGEVDVERLEIEMGAESSSQ